MDIELKLTEGVAPEEEEIILNRLKAYNVATFGQSDRRELAVPLYDDGGKVIGGLTGYTGRGWLYVAMLYIPDALRGRGLAARMLDMAEAEARARGCIGAYIDTMNPQALRLYLKQGYREIGRLRDLAGGHSVTWLEKRF
ncbi:Acetyltransferase (GNAT) family protein [Xaviernesmea oryzae]|uniref:Acetyltransferase (GNAT) family protein n=1 Tax=Xaviernesmea oryzae TaxID=464029 RepID=A0A1X7GU90_9HYPH|nr:GNAT family N-acetyltransferase [Xaviernesmea oryzae]SMF74345.1 Acetyltransferase (GNAT) family protein [Xaviernesmea oryzae]